MEEALRFLDKMEGILSSLLLLLMAVAEALLGVLATSPAMQTATHLVAVAEVQIQAVELPSHRAALTEIKEAGAMALLEVVAEALVALVVTLHQAVEDREV
jgi:hypothetical protein